jgi:YD repeat-containing protein
MKFSLIRQVVAFVLLIVVSVGAQAAFELWSEEPPDLPAGARTVTIHRTIMVRNAVQQQAEAHKFTQIDRETDGVIVRRIYDSTGEFLWEAFFEYEGERLVRIRAVDSGERWRLAFEYDAEGRLIRERYFAGDRAPERTIVYRYGRQMTEVISYRPDGSVDWRRIDVPGDAEGERRKTFFYGDGTRFKTIIYILDQDGLAIAERHLDEVGATYERVERSHTDSQRVEESIWNGTNALVRHTVWEYDNGGRLVARMVRIPEDGREERLLINYRFNDRGDWIERLETSYAQFEGEPAFVTDRIFKARHIEYIDDTVAEPTEPQAPAEPEQPAAIPPAEPAEPARPEEPAEPDAPASSGDSSESG